MPRILTVLLSMLLAIAIVGCDQQESTATSAPAASADQAAPAPAPAVDQAAPASAEASAKIDEAVEAGKVAAAKTGEAAQVVVAEASDKVRETASEAYAKAGEAVDLAGQAASDIAADLKQGASEAMDNLGVAADKAGEAARETGAKAADQAGKALSGAADKAREMADGLRSPSEPSSSPAGASGLTLEFLAHQKFTLKKVNEADYHGERVPFIEFGDNGMVSGKICNTFRGPGKLSGGVLTVQSMASTRMLCPANGLDELETRFFDMLSQGAEISMDGSQLTFKQGGTVLVFEADTAITA